MTDTSPVPLSPSGPPETVLDDEPASVREALNVAAAADGDERRRAVADVAASSPRSLLAWAALGDDASNDIEAYAYYRVGYHRGLDKLRQSGWRGTGYVRWGSPSNRGFLRCVAGLERVAGAIGESDEQERCAIFLRQLDPSWPPADLPS